MAKRKVAWNHSRHDRDREYPKRGVLNLFSAAEQRGLSDVTREYEVYDEENDRYYWFDVSGLWEGRRYLFDFEPGYRDSRPTAAEKERQAAKKDWAERAGIPLMFMPLGYSAQEMGVILYRFIVDTEREEENGTRS